MTTNEIVLLEQLLVVGRDALVEAEPESEEVGQRGQPGVHHDLGQRVPVDGEGRKAGPAAHPEQSIGAGRRADRTAATTSAACSSDRTGLIGIATCVRASSSVAGQLHAGAPLGHRGLAVRGHAVVDLVADARGLQALREAVDRLVAHDVEMPRGVAARRGPRQLDQLAEPGALVGRGAGAAAVAPRVQVRQLARAGSPPAARPGASCGPTSSNVPLSLEPWKRSSRILASSSGSFVTTAPPSPNAPRFFDGKNENVAIVPSAPGRPPALSEPAACAASSTTGTPSASISRDRRDVAEQVHGDHGLRARRQRGAHGLGGHAARVRVDVAEHGPGARVRDRLGGRVEGEGGHDDLVAGADAERAQREHQRVGAVGDAGGVARAEVGGELVPRRRLTSGPRMNTPRSTTSAIFASISARSGASGVLVSNSGTAMVKRRRWPYGVSQ